MTPRRESPDTDKSEVPVVEDSEDELEPDAGPLIDDAFDRWRDEQP